MIWSRFVVPNARAYVKQARLDSRLPIVSLAVGVSGSLRYPGSG